MDTGKIKIEMMKFKRERVWEIAKKRWSKSTEGYSTPHRVLNFDLWSPFFADS